MALVDTLAVFVAGLVVGGFGIYVGGRAVTGSGSFSRALKTALLAAIAWAVFSYVPLIGSFLALLAWIAVINWRHEGGWIDAVIIGLLAWLTTLLVLYGLSAFGAVSLDAVGIPGA